ncbi:uncharacterized RING finger protein YBR062C-like [Vicia villosa]|uniref:uncharacterized RING finger protein YBR062C-like n=1 Tax=Vicia villosa TaxID=3911 RepID=UPI00273C21AD|nr:uncharacterized RING finger protein YBR062C-like [Vicia villosa]
MASQAKQVFYVIDPSNISGKWSTVLPGKHIPISDEILDIPSTPSYTTQVPTSYDEVDGDVVHAIQIDYKEEKDLNRTLAEEFRRNQSEILRNQNTRSSMNHERQEVRILIRNQHEIIRNQNARASMNHDRRGAGVEVSFNRRAENARRVIKELPVLKTFKGDDGTANCPICMEEFKKGELIQPFGLCAHEFHSSCLNSWLHGGKTTCPICRQDLLSNV